MIKNIEIKNFQSHKKTKLELSEGVNVIVGPSDSGKTAIIRAIRWVSENRPGGDAFRSRWRGETKVTITTDKKIIRCKSDNENLYQVGGMTFKGFGQSVPEPVYDALKLAPVNFQHQMDPPFMVSWSAGEVTRFLNDIVGLTAIDTSIKNARAETRNWAWKRTLSKENIENIEEDLKSFEWISKAAIRLKDAEENEKELIGFQSYVLNLSSIIEKLTNIEDKILSFTNIELCKKLLNKAIEANNDLANLTNSLDHLTKLKNKVKAIQKKREGLREITSQATLLSRAISIYSQYKKAAKNSARLDYLIKQIKANKSKMKAKNLAKETLEKEFKALMPNVCPLCGQQTKRRRDQ